MCIDWWMDESSCVERGCVCECWKPAVHFEAVSIGWSFGSGIGNAFSFVVVAQSSFQKSHSKIPLMLMSAISHDKLISSSEITISIIQAYSVEN